VPRARVLSIASELASAGASEIGFGDTTGMANPLQVREFFEAARSELPGVELTAHFHNTRGQGLANVLAALEAGVDSFESSFGELGGCPVPAGATGNIATEDLVSMLHEMGIDTGIDLGALIEASRAAQQVLGRPLGSHVLTAGPVDWARSA
jgi:hydroxymethylglutaryl-CoA lyase